MSATESETTATPPTDDDVIRIEADVIVHHTGFAWPWTWLPWAPPAGNGNGGAGSTAYSPAAAPPYWPYPGDGPYRDRGYLYWPWWLSSVLAVLGVLVAATVAAFVLAWAYGELFNDNAKPAAPVAKVMTMPKLLASEHFAVNQHAVCSYVAVANGTAYKLYLNRGAACRRTIQTIVPATMVSGTAWTMSVPTICLVLSRSG